MDAAQANAMGEWFDLCHRASVSLRDASAMADTLLQAYGEPIRRYHTLDHVQACLRGTQNMPLDADVRIIVELALWFHDVVYDPKAPDNEDRSARLAQSWVTEHVDPSGEVGHEVAALIEMTAGHELSPTAGVSAQVVHDVDLQILGADPETYDRYAADIRAEYAHVSDDDFRIGRITVLSAMLAADPIYVLPGFQTQFEPQARRNMQREIDALQRG